MASNKWLTALLVGSLVLNVALLGYLVGRASGEHLRPPLGNPLMGMGSVIRELPEPRRTELTDAMRAHARSLRPPVREMLGSRKALRDALRAEPFQPEAVSEALQTMQQNLCRSMARSNESFVALAAMLSPEERALLLKNMERRDRHEHDRPPPPPRPAPIR